MEDYTLMIAPAIAFFIFVFIWLREKHPVLTNWPILGMLPSLYRNAPRIHDFLADIMTQTGGTFVFKGPPFANMDFTVTCDPNNVQYILSTNFANFPRGSQFVEILDPTGDGFINADKELWKLQRRLIQSSLKKENIFDFLRGGIKRKIADGLIPILNHAATDLCSAIDLQKVFRQFSFDNVCLMVLGMDPSSLSSSKSVIIGKYQRAFDQIEEAVMLRIIRPSCLWKLQRWLHIGHEKELDEAIKTLDPLIYECITMQKQQIRLQKEDDGKLDHQVSQLMTILTPFIDLQDQQKICQDGEVEVTDKLLRDVTLSLLFAGRDTVSVSLTWFFFMIGTHPSVETKLLREIQKNLDSNEESRVFPECKLENLVYMHAVFCETLRLYPPVSFNLKTAVLPVDLPSGHTMSGGAKVVLPFCAMGRMESIWGLDCKEFKPERWINDQGKIMHVPPNKFAAFNVGPRSCLGKELSFMQMKMVAASVLMNFHVGIVEGQPVEPVASIVLQMKNGLKVRIRKRSRSELTVALE